MIARVLFSFLAAIFFAAYAPDSLDAGQETFQEKAPASVIKKISAGESQNILILFDDSAIESETSLMRGLYGVIHDTQDMLDLKARRYKDIKERVLKSIPKREFAIIKDYSHLPLIFLKARSSTALSRLLGRTEVAKVYEDQAYTHFLVQSLPLMNQPQVASSIIVGTGTTVAVLDTGVDYTLTAFGNCTAPGVPAGCKVSFAQDFAPNDYSLDNNGHGTNVAGIVLGVAPGTKIAALDVFRSNGYAYSSDIISAINWCIANKSSYNVVAVNLSLGGGSYTQPCTGDIFANPIANARAAGILSAIASGNNGYVNRLSSPACVPSAVSVGAVYDANIGSKYWTICYDTTTAADRVACFSNSASFLTLLAPGSVITAAGISMSGTSQATPHIAGSIAVLKGEGAFPEATPDEIVSRITDTGVPVTDWRNGITKPRIDLLAAIGTQTPPVANFTGSPASGTAPLNVNFTDTSTGSPATWLWDFGDGGASNLQNPSHEYNAAGTYTVSLTVSNDNGSDTETKTGYITVQAAVSPVANFTGSPASGTAPLNVNFTDTSTGSPATWLWDFGDGGASNLQNPSHEYNAAGTYTVSLTVSNSNGSDTETKTGYITVQACSIPPAIYIIYPLSGIAGNSVTIYGTNFQSPLSVYFNGAQAAVIYSNYNRIMTTVPQNATSGPLCVEGPLGCKSNEKIFTVTGAAPAPNANFTGSPASGTAPLNVNFTDTSTGSPTVWLWDFGDGGASNLQNPSHEYNAAGTYTVSLTVSNDNGSDTETKTGYITVSDPGQFATITVTTPNGGERWSLFSYQAIRWTYSGNPGSTVRIELYKSGVLNRVLSSGRLTNTGSYFWFVPYTITPGSDYRIKITSTSNPSYNDTSDANFTIDRGF